MFHLDNSETSWLVYADWLADQDIDATHIRQEIVFPITNTWHYEFYKLKGVGVGARVGEIGGGLELGLGIEGVGYVEGYGGGLVGVVGGGKVGCGIGGI